MNNIEESIYHTRIETEDKIRIVWKPFSAYSTPVILAGCMLFVFVELPILSLLMVILMIANAVLYSTECKQIRQEIKLATQNSSVQVSGSKYSLSSPLTITIMDKAVVRFENSEEKRTDKKRGGPIKKLLFSFGAALFGFFAYFSLTAGMSGIRQGIYVWSIVLLMIIALFFGFLAYLCFKGLKK